jgi:myosin heavy subunit
MGWVTSFSNGELLYFHSETGEVTSLCPQELLDEDGSYVWIAHDEEIFLPCKIIETNDELLSVESLNGHLMNINSPSVGEAIPSIRSLLKLPNDLIEMDSISQPAVYYTLRARFLQDQIYTSLGDILLIVNPFKFLPNPSMETISTRVTETVTTPPPPHPYLTAARAYDEMLHSNINQTILIGGESGSGKTETTKTCLRYLSHISNHLDPGSVSASPHSLNHVEGRIMASNPLLEAFGNAKTIRNDNSSRFGKFLELIYSRSGVITACRTTSYLLEKCRVHRQNTGERNYHIFYQLCRAIETAISSLSEGRVFSDHVGGRDGGQTATLEGEQRGSVLDHESFLSKLQILSLEEFDLLTSSGCIDIEGMNDCHAFLETEAAAMTLGFTRESIQLLVSTCAAILHLGNIQFLDSINSDGAESCLIGGIDDFSSQRSVSSLAIAAELLEVDSNQLSTALRVRKLFIRGEQTDVQLTSSQAKEARDSICKTLYSHLFDWIVRNVTVTFTGPGSSAGALSSSTTPALQGKFIGILDIFGFEIFDVNYFEQVHALPSPSLPHSPRHLPHAIPSSSPR